MVGMRETRSYGTAKKAAKERGLYGNAGVPVGVAFVATLLVCECFGINFGGENFDIDSSGGF